MKCFSSEYGMEPWVNSTHLHPRAESLPPQIVVDSNEWKQGIHSHGFNGLDGLSQILVGGQGYGAAAGNAELRSASCVHFTIEQLARDATYAEEY
ncbi:hypothetical protein OAT16_00050 [Prolixibacteraceae bacterium]|nr:hypothetical protein [Prolixibacteraceae bacterium]